MNLLTQIAKSKANVVRRVYIKRREAFTGKFESNWLEITDDVKRFGKITKTIDAARPYKFNFANVNLEMANESGRYNPHDNESSLWYNYLNQQRTLVKYEVAFVDIDDTSKPYKIISEYPSSILYDKAFWDANISVWDSDPVGSTVFTGVISGDISVNDKNHVTFTIKPLTSVFKGYQADRLTGYTSTGITATQFMESLRDHVDSNGEYVFRPFFGDTTANWEFSTTSNVYTLLNTSGAEPVITKDCWEIIEKLSEAENFVPYVDGGGVFKFVSRDSVDTLSAYQFYGAGYFSSTYGNTIKSVDDYGFKQTKYYSKVQIKFGDTDTYTSYVSKQAAFVVNPLNGPWTLGDKSLNIDNNFFGSSAAALTACNTIFNEVSALKNEIKFKTSLVLGIDIFDRFGIWYDPSEVNQRSLWDLNSWADIVSASDDLYWDKPQGEQVTLDGDEFKFLSFSINLDDLTNDFIAREV